MEKRVTSGSGGENILKNLSENLVEDISPEDAFFREDPSPRR